MRAFLEFLVVFLPTLQDYYYYDIGVAPFPICAAVILAFLCVSDFSLTMDARDSMLIVFVLLISLISVLIGALHPGGDVYPKSVYAVVLGPLYALGFLRYFRKRSRALMRYLEVALCVHVAVIAVQYFTYYVFGYYPDLLVNATGEEQRYAGAGPVSGLIRPTGLFSEPAHFALYVITLLCLTNRFRRNLKPLDYIALLAVLFNFSLLGVSVIVGFMLCYLLSGPRNWFVKAAIPVAGFCIVQLPMGARLLENAQARFSRLAQDQSFVSRFTAAFNYFDSLSPMSKAFGIGLGNFGDFISYGSTYTYLLVHLGLVPSVLLCSLLVYFLRAVCQARLAVLAFLAILFCGTLMPTYVIFWMVFSSIAALERSEVKPRQGIACTSRPRGSGILAPSNV